MPKSARLVAGLCLAAVLAITGCAAGGTAGAPQSGAVQPVPSMGQTAIPTSASGTHITKVLVFVLENHSLEQMMQDLPYTFGIAKQYGYATHYTAITHPSLPNYLAISGGQTAGVTNDLDPSQVPVLGASVFGQAIAAGKTAGVYADAMKSNCETVNDGSYAVRHNPWTYYRAERADCQKYDVPLAALPAAISAGTIPNVGMVVPDTCNDAHSCPLSTADAWMKIWMPRVMAGPDWASGRLAIIVTADEDYNNLPGNSVLTTVAFRGETPRIVSTPLTHYSLTRLYEDVAGVPHLAHAATASSLSKAFGFSP
jgi:hypothetical protein